MRTAIFLAVLMLVATAARAQDADPYDASVALGYVGTTGNTDTSTFNTEVLLTWRMERWTHKGKFQGMGSVENDVTRAERYYLEDKSDFNLSDNQYVFVKGSWTDDRFSGFDYQASASAGYGIYLLRSDNVSLETFVGAGYRQNHIIGTVPGEPDGAEGEAIASVGENFTWQIGSTSALKQSLTSEAGSDLTVTRFEIGLESTVVRNIATKIAFQARNTSVVPAGNKKTDTQTSVSLVYSF